MSRTKTARSLADAFDQTTMSADALRRAVEGLRHLFERHPLSSRTPEELTIADLSRRIEITKARRRARAPGYLICARMQEAPLAVRFLVSMSHLFSSYKP